MSTATRNEKFTASRSASLSAVTDDLHEHLHTLVAAADPFASHERFAIWLAVQYRFLWGLEPLYHLPALRQLLPNLAECTRLRAVEADLDTLGVPHPRLKLESIQTGLPEALGALFVSEGSTLGAAVLLKRARALGLSESQGARHLAASPAGRGRHWKQFARTLDEMPLGAEDERRLQEAARTTFRHFGNLLVGAFKLPA